jgi:alpha-glucoside transport system substrate-binding protein
MRNFKWLLLLAVFALVAAACGGDSEETTTAAGGATATTAATTQTTAGGATATTAGGTTETTAASMEVGADFVLEGAPTGIEGEALQGFLDVYNEQTGSNVQFVGSDGFEQQLRIEVEGGNPPQVAELPQPGSICEFAGDGLLLSLEDMGFDVTQMEENSSKFWMDLGLCDDGMHYGIPWFPNFKSIVFYHQPTFDAMGYSVPSSYEDMVSMSAQMVSDGYTPWCFGFGSGDATGWPGTDWIEDIYVRQSGGDMYAEWFKHEIPFNDPSVVAAFDKFGEIFFGDGFVLGGPDAVASIDFRDSPGPLFADNLGPNGDGPGCLMLKQGSFIANYFEQAPDYTDGEESEIGVFTFPTIDGNPGAMGGGDTMIVFKDAEPASIQAVKDWITPDWECTLASATGGGVAKYGGHGVEGVERLPGNKNVDVNCYETDTAKAFAAAVIEALDAQTFVFDASDLMPSEVGQGTFWTAMVDWSQGASSQDVTDTVEASWP